MDWTVGLFISVVLAAWALVNIWGAETERGAKIAWSIFVLVFPIFGTLIWYFAGPKREQA
jgi:hypothetical protein